MSKGTHSRPPRYPLFPDILDVGATPGNKNSKKKGPRLQRRSPLQLNTAECNFNCNPNPDIRPTLVLYRSASIRVDSSSISSISASIFPFVVEGCKPYFRNIL